MHSVIFSKPGVTICNVNGLGGFNSHLANSKELEASSSTRSSDLDELPTTSMICYFQI
jgi:hypothetical protein